MEKFQKYTFVVNFYEANDSCYISVGASDLEMAKAKIRGIVEDTLDYMFTLKSVEDIQR